MAPLGYATKSDPFLSMDCAPTPSTLAQSKERKGPNFAIWQPCVKGLTTSPFDFYTDMVDDLVAQERSYDSLPNFTAADCE